MGGVSSRLVICFFSADRFRPSHLFLLTFPLSLSISPIQFLYLSAPPPASIFFLHTHRFSLTRFRFLFCLKLEVRALRVILATDYQPRNNLTRSSPTSPVSAGQVAVSNDDDKDDTFHPKREPSSSSGVANGSSSLAPDEEAPGNDDNGDDARGLQLTAGSSF